MVVFVWLGNSICGIVVGRVSAFRCKAAPNSLDRAYKATARTTQSLSNGSRYALGVFQQIKQICVHGLVCSHVTCGRVRILNRASQIVESNRTTINATNARDALCFDLFISGRGLRSNSGCCETTR